VKATEKEIKEALFLLAETPLRIAHLTKSIEKARLQERLDNQWSVNDILAHLRSCADVWGDSIDAMLTENIPILPDLHPRKWIKETNYLELSFHESFPTFVRQRQRLLMTLKKLSFEDWSRAATIAGRKHTVFTQARRMGKHEKEHCEQIESLLQRDSRR
jgi:hypothetical protein